VEEAMKIANAPSISVGIIHGLDKDPIFRKSYGLRNFENRLYADSDTSYIIGGCSKMITCAAIGVLVEENLLEWDDRVRKHLPAFDPQGDPEIGEAATIIDLCRHSTGLADPTPIFAGPGGTIFNTAEDHIAFVNTLPTADSSGQRFQKRWWLSQAAFGLLAQIIEAVAGISFSEFLQKRIFRPLRMSQTNIIESKSERDYNIALPYVRLSDGTWSKIETGKTYKDHGPFVASMGMSSSVNDMLAFMAAVMNAYDQGQGAQVSQPLTKARSTNPLKHIAAMWSYWLDRLVDDGFANETAYALGWFRTTMPTAALGMSSYNRYADDESCWVDEQTILGKESKRRTLYGYNGVTNGFVATAYLFPEAHTAIVALSNTANAGDAAETASRIMLQALFKLKPRVSTLQPLRKARDGCINAHEKMVAEWQLNRDVARFTGASKDFIGSYIGLNSIRIGLLEIDSDSDHESVQLAVVFGDNPASKCALEPYNADMLSFLPLNREVLISRGMLAWTSYKMGIFEFVRDEDGEVAGFWWQLDPYEYPSLWVRDQAGMGPQQIQEVLDKFGQFRVEGKIADVKPVGSGE
jgi:CubicO group peptidase (beta-lactamase class C family)